MILLPHMLIGAALGAKVHNFWIIFFGSLLLHLATDTLPHWDYVQKKYYNKIWLLAGATILDIALGYAAIFLIMGRDAWPYAFWGAAFSLAPDLLNPLDGLTRGQNKIIHPAFVFCQKFHTAKKDGRLEIYFQIGFTLSLMALLYLIK